jgi:hypothetical protein
MWPPVLFSERGLGAKLVLGGLLPLLFGALCGVLLGESKLWFAVVSTAGIAGGINAGAEHIGWREGCLRGISGGVLFSAALVLVHAVRGVPTLGVLPASLWLSAVLFSIVSAPFGALGGWLRGWCVRASSAA